MKALEESGNALWINFERVTFGKGLEHLGRGLPGSTEGNKFNEITLETRR